jgi:hypothetical protein
MLRSFASWTTSDLCKECARELITGVGRGDE